HWARLDDRHPPLRRALPGAHPRLGGLLGVGLVREDVDPDLAAALDLARHSDPGSLDLPVGQPARLQRLEAVVPVLHVELASCLASRAAAVLFAELGFLREQHYPVASSSPPEGPGSSGGPSIGPLSATGSSAA